MMSIKKLTVSSLLIAVSVVLGMFSVQLGNFIKIGFSLITIEIIGYLFGPIIGGISGGISDILQFLARPTGPFFPGFTLNAILCGVICGIGLHNKKVTIKRVSVVILIKIIVIDFILTSIHLHLLYGEAFRVLLVTRIIKVIAMYPINLTLTFYLLKFVNGVKHYMDLQE